MIDPAITRARYGGAGSFIAGLQSARPSQLTVRAFNFGQHWRTPNIENVCYNVTLPDAFFRDVLAAELPPYVDDARRFPDTDDELENALRSRLWPDATAVRNDPRIALMALDWLAYTLLLLWFGDGEPPDSPGFVINTVDSVGFVGSNPEITGQARTAVPMLTFDSHRANDHEV